MKKFRVIFLAITLLVVARIYMIEASPFGLKNRIDNSIERLLSDPKAYEIHQMSVKFAEANLDDVLNSPLPSEVLHTIKTLPLNDREKKCKDIFARAFQSHTNVIWVNYKKLFNTNSPSSRYSTRNTQLTVCVALYATAEMGAQGLLAEELAQINRLKTEMDQRILTDYANSKRFASGFAPEFITFCMHRYYFPDNCFQTNVLNLVAAQSQRRSRSS
jgi:hypothetical protein